MACNTPIIASFDLHSDLAEVIKDSGAGSCVQAGDVGALVEAILDTFENWKKGDQSSVELREYVKFHARKRCLS